MAQEYILVNDTPPKEEEIHPALTRCKNCNQIVPKTMLCLYCGKPILYKHPVEE